MKKRAEKKLLERPVSSDEKRRQLRAEAAHARALEGHNGWDNYETWCVHLWLSNTQHLRENARLLALPGTEAEGAERIKDFIDHLKPDLGATFAADLLNSALDAVNWMELVRAIREES